MANAYNANHAVRMDGLLSDVLEIDTAGVPIAYEVATPYAGGTGAYQCNMIYSYATVSASPVFFDLTASLTGPLGDLLTFTKIRGFAIRCVTATAGVFLTIAGNFITTVVLSGTTPTKKIGAGGIWYDENPVDGYTVTNLTADTITVTPSASASFQIRLWGTI